VGVFSKFSKGVKDKKWKRRGRRSNFKIGLGVKDKKWKKGEYPKFGWE